MLVQEWVMTPLLWRQGTCCKIFCCWAVVFVVFLCSAHDLGNWPVRLMNENWPGHMLAERVAYEPTVVSKIITPENLYTLN